VAKIAPLNVPVTVDTSGMDKGLKTAEQKMKRSAERMNKAAAGGGAAGRASKGVAMAGASTLGFGAAGGALGAMGGVGFAVGAVAAPFLAAGRMAQSLADATKGATDQLKTFKESGEVGTFGNRLMLETLSSMEAAAQARVSGPSFAQQFFAGEKLAGGAGPTNTETFMDFWNSAGGRLGAILGGASWEESGMIQPALEAPEGPIAERRRQQLESEQRAIRSEGYSSFGEAPLSWLAETIARAIMVPSREQNL
jgi:hypothetical protein